MRDFSYRRAGSADEARRSAAIPGAVLLAGGTTLLDLAKCGVAEPEHVVDITRLPGLDAVTVESGRASIGALAKMSLVADDAVSSAPLDSGAPLTTRLYAAWRRARPVLAVVAAALLWWPTGFWGLDAWLHVPLRAIDGDVVLLSATASAAVMAALVAAPWPRLAVVVGGSALAWWLSAPAVDSAPLVNRSWLLRSA